METSLKTGFAQIFSCCPKNLSCPTFGGAAAPLAPPARTPMNLWLFFVPQKKPWLNIRQLNTKGEKPPRHKTTIIQI